MTFKNNQQMPKRLSKLFPSLGDRRWCRFRHSRFNRATLEIHLKRLGAIVIEHMYADGRYRYYLVEEAHNTIKAVTADDIQIGATDCYGEPTVLTWQRATTRIILPEMNRD